MQEVNFDLTNYLSTYGLREGDDVQVYTDAECWMRVSHTQKSSNTAEPSRTARLGAASEACSAAKRRKAGTVEAEERPSALDDGPPGSSSSGPPGTAPGPTTHRKCRRTSTQDYGDAAGNAAGTLLGTAGADARESPAGNAAGKVSEKATAGTAGGVEGGRLPTDAPGNAPRKAYAAENAAANAEETLLGSAPGEARGNEAKNAAGVVESEREEALFGSAEGKARGNEAKNADGVVESEREMDTRKEAERSVREGLESRGGEVGDDTVRGRQLTRDVEGGTEPAEQPHGTQDLRGVGGSEKAHANKCDSLLLLSGATALHPLCLYH